MPAIELRKRLTVVEEIFHEGGPAAPTPLRRAAALAVIRNPFAGAYVEDIAGLMEDLRPLGLDMAKALVAALGGNARVVEGYGKGAIVGAAGELEHGALWHVPGGYAMREILGGAKAIVASSKKVGGPGTRLDVPITHINASYVRSHFDSMEVGLADAPRVERNSAGVGDDDRAAHSRSRRRFESVGDQGRGWTSMKSRIRKIVTFVEETRTEMGRVIEPPTRRAAAVAVIENPCAGKYVEDLSELMAIGEELGGLLAERAVAALGIAGPSAESYGKAAAVGEDGEIEHAAAILHPKLGTPVRKALGKGAALIPSSKKRGGLGVVLDIPLGHKDAAFVRSHFDGMEVRINDAPRANEIMVAVAVTDSGRPLARVGGLKKEEIKGEDGLR